MTSPAPAEPGQPLTGREIQVITGMANGEENRQIAERLGLSVNTVKSHSSRIYRKLAARDRAHAVGLAIATRQLPPRAVQITAPPQPKT
ncbi:DNA-binding NarL/FixJ family response regulator [Kitasatospora gansuensis]|uniref:DNA-binding NarL/FixJ family response regulator n=1 Tax=Kitasatospora gansuensis TaxID=258050 RepID=A0A7W7WHL0_9ACTN|nr:helix-turn-helix transcriptional regulator [Kitasatospora gansuensis]MBB4946845.1 DNA-binding NarL/FixJ family response regulator [Kitasatospora gansuensis]